MQQPQGILFNDATSPFGRKALVTAIEAGVVLEEQFINVFEFGALTDKSPLHQIPVFQTSSGAHLFDSNVIAAHLAAISQKPDFQKHAVTPETSTFLAALDGLMETVLKYAMEHKQPAKDQRTGFIFDMARRIENCLTWLAERHDTLSPTYFSQPEIYAACALDYTNLRYGTDWQKRFPDIAHWLASVSERPSLKYTRPARKKAIANTAELHS